MAKNISHTQILDIMIEATLGAGKIIMDIYQHSFVPTTKSDGTPVTIADQKAEALILSCLEKTGLPVLAEESVAAGKIPESGHKYFIVDPLDGTKEFIKRNGQFTVNIALIENGTPTLGIVSVPASGQLFIGTKEGAFEYETRENRLGEKRPICVATNNAPKAVASLSHRHQHIEALCKALNIEQTLSVGSSLKFCMIARGDAQIYPRFSPTCEWDTAAGQAVLQAAGGVVLKLDGSPISYGRGNKKFINPAFIAAANLQIAKSAIEEMNRLCSDSSFKKFI